MFFGYYTRCTSVPKYRQWSFISKTTLVNATPFRTGIGIPSWHLLFSDGIRSELPKESTTCDNMSLGILFSELLTTSTDETNCVTLHLSKFVLRVACTETDRYTLNLMTSVIVSFGSLARQIIAPDTSIRIPLLEIWVVGALLTAISTSTTLFGYLLESSGKMFPKQLSSGGHVVLRPFFNSSGRLDGVKM